MLLEVQILSLYVCCRVGMWSVRREYFKDRFLSELLEWNFTFSFLHHGATDDEVSGRKVKSLQLPPTPWIGQSNPGECSFLVP